MIRVVPTDPDGTPPGHGDSPVAQTTRGASGETGSFVEPDGREHHMYGIRKRLLVGSALAGVAVLSAGVPALAATRGHATHHRTVPAHGTTRPAATTPSVEIGTAVQYERNSDGTISPVSPPR